MSYDFTGATVSSTYGRIVQVVYGTPNLYYDGFGNLLDLGAGTSSVGPQGPTGSQGISMVFQGEWDSMMMYFYYDFVTYNGNSYICISDLTGSAPWISPDLDTTHWQQMLIGLSGTSGYSGTSGTSGLGGTSGTSGVNGIDGTSGTSGLNGTSGTSATSGYSGTSGTSVSTNYVYKTSTYSISNSDYYIEANGTFDVTLPNAVGISGKTFIIKNTGTGVITIQTTSSQLIDNLPSYTLSFYDTLQVESNGTNWLVDNTSTKTFIRVYNNTGSIIPKGTALKIQSTYNTIPSVSLPIANASGNQQVIGLAYIDIPIASEGIALSSGILSGLNLSSYSVGDILYLSDIVAGGFVNSVDSLQYASRTNKIGYITSTSSTIGTIQVELSNENLNLSITDIQRNILEGNVISTGLFDFSSPGISLYSSTKFNVATASGWIVYNVGTYSVKPEVKLIEYPGATGVTASFLNTSTITYLLLDSNSQLIQQNTFPTPQQRRENIYLGKLGHADKSSLINVFNEPDIEYSPLSQVRDMFTPIKLINQGVYPSANGSNLNFNTSAGTLWGLGIGSVTNQLNPSSISISGQSPTTFQYRTQLGGTSSDVTLIDPTKWDNLGTLTTITGAAKQATNQRIFLVQNGKIRVQYGQQVYADLSTAILNIQNEVFTTFSNFSNNGILIGILSVSSDTTNLSDISHSRFFLVSKFGELIGGSGGLSTTTLQQAYDNSSTPEIVTNSTLGAVTFKRGSLLETDNVFEVQSGVDGVTFSVTGQGRVNTNTLTITGIGSTSSLTKYMVIDDGGNTYYQTTNPGGGSGTSGTSGNTGTSGTSGFNGTSGINGTNGAGGSLGYYGSFYSTLTQLNPSASIPTPMTINSTYESNGVSLLDNSKLLFSSGGTYNIQFSAVFHKDNSNAANAQVWFVKNGIYLTQSNTSFTIAGQSDQIAAWNFIQTLDDNDYMEVFWSSPDTNISIQSTSNIYLPGQPSVPSVIISAQQVMYTQLGATGSNGTSGMSGTSGTSGILGTSGTSGISANPTDYTIGFLFMGG